MDTLASGRIVVTNPDHSPSPEIQLEELFRLGSLSEEGPELFGEIGAVALGARGELYVLDSQALEVRVFGEDGAFQRSFGREGEGPGELRSPAGMAVDADENVWILNCGNSRYTAFDPSSGELVDERRRLASFVAFPWPGAFDEEGRLLDMGLGPDGAPALLRTDTAFVPTDTLALPQPDDDSRIVFRRDGQMVMATMEPFAPSPSWAPHPGGGIVVGEGAAYRLHRIQFDGDTTLTVELLREPQRVTRAERELALDAFAETVERAGGAVPDRQPRVRETKPLHGALFVDDVGRIWVRSTPPPRGPPAWDLFSPAGRYMGQATVPTPLAYVRPAVRNGRLAVVALLDDVPHVVVYRIVDPAS